MDKDIERVHYLNWPFVARYVRFHPMDWHRHISMRAGVIGCPYKGSIAIHDRATDRPRLSLPSCLRPFDL